MKKTYIIGVALGALTLAGCQDVLDEQPRTSADMSVFESAEGVKSGLTALYASLRTIYGPGYYFNSQETGTDEYTFGQSADGNFKAADVSGQAALNATSCRSDVLWGPAFKFINTACGVLERGADAGMDESLLAEAAFFRAFYFFHLVRTFGGVPLDLGSGELKMNTSTVRSSVRCTVPEVYSKAIFPDLKNGLEKLPDNPRLPGCVTKTVARYWLSKAYLTFGWWLQNTDVPTYPECQRVDLDGHDAAWYFQQAYDLAVEAIKSPGSYSLQDSYYDVTRAENDRNSEWLMWADHTHESEKYNGVQFEWPGEGGETNSAAWMATSNYTDMCARPVGQDWGKSVAPVQRATNDQFLGRPWTRMVPPREVFTEIFTDTKHDSRYDGTFTMSYKGNWNAVNKDIKKVYGANDMEVSPGEPVLTFLTKEEAEEYEAAGTPVDYSKGDYFPYAPEEANMSGQIKGAGTVPGRADFVIAPSEMGRQVYPGLYKQGPWRPDQEGLGHLSSASTRPFCICKFSEFYLLAAEAAVKGATTQAGYTPLECVNVLRKRAGKWVCKNNLGQPYETDFGQEMMDATPQDITISYILDERMREFFGEQMRWFDLTRTNMWETKAGHYTICNTGTRDKRKVESVARTITKEMYLRPIPQGQIDALEMTDAEKDAYQNPYYLGK